MISRLVPIGAVILLMLLPPLFAHAFPFGGRASIVLQCPYNSTIYVNLGPPRGGEYVWTTATRTYLFGPPSHAGQWILGLAGAPYYCIYKISPLTIYTAIAITMMGSSGPAAPAAPPTRGPALPAPPPGSSPAPAPAPPSGTPGGGAVLISEVYYAVDAEHGAKPANEWFEIYNGTSAAVNLGGWTIQDGISSDAIPTSAPLAPGKFAVVAAASSTRALWSMPEGVLFISLGNPIGDGLGNGGDRIVLRNVSGTIIDAVSWGTNTTVFNPAALTVSYGESFSRLNLPGDTNTRYDWGARAPSPGK